jgi:hypothetical protein
MAGARRRLERAEDDRVRLAHMTALFTRTQKLSGDVRKYLPRRGQQKAQTPDEMLAMLRALQAGGAPMTITKAED